VILSCGNNNLLRLWKKVGIENFLFDIVYTSSPIGQQYDCGRYAVFGVTIVVDEPDCCIGENQRGKEMSYQYDDDDFDNSDDDYDAAKDAYLTGEGPPVTGKQQKEVDDWNEECRRNKWR